MDNGVGCATHCDLPLQSRRMDFCFVLLLACLDSEK